MHKGTPLDKYSIQVKIFDTAVKPFNTEMKVLDTVKIAVMCGQRFFGPAAQHN
jgi:hypothetical protein